MRIAGIEADDFINGEGTSVSLWTQGCPFHCENCHNPETWSPYGGSYINNTDLINQIKELLTRNGIQRNLSILGGEPLWRTNGNDVNIAVLLNHIKRDCPNTKIFLWTGYTWEDLIQDEFISCAILPYIDVLIDGQFIQSERDITLWLRGSRNQRVIDVQESLKAKEVKLYTKA